MREVLRAGYKLVVAVGLISAGVTALAEPNAPARVQAFAALPDWSGIWLSAAWPLDASGRVPGGEAQLRKTLQLLHEPPYNPTWELKYAEGMRDTAAVAARSANFKLCARSFPALMEGPWMFQIAVLPEETLLVFENDQVRHVYTDGRQHPAATDLWPTRLGDSIGRWEGDTLSVDTIARTSSEPLAPRAWLSLLSDQAHFTERLRLLSRDELEDELTVEDPTALARAWHITLRFHRVAQLNRMIPYDCTENDRNPVVDGKLTIAPPTAQAGSSKEGPAVQALRHLVATDSELKRLLVESIEQARKVNPDLVTNPVQTLGQYFDFIAFTERAQPGRMVVPTPTSTLYQRLDQGLCYLYFVSDQPLKELRGRGYFNDSIQYYPPYNAWLREFVRSWGAALDLPTSWDARSLTVAQDDPVFGLQNGWYEDASQWHTFNEFFTRRLKSPAARPIASPSDNTVVASPVDAIPQGTWRIDAHSNLVDPEGAPLKSGTVRSIAQLVGEHSAYKDAFAGGTFTHVFLDVGDYHRYHFPLDGVVREAGVIPGSEVTGGFITWDASHGRYAFDPSSAGWQALETRGSVILETPDFGLVALLPIGMSPVSSVTIDPAVKAGAKVHKGDEIGRFAFGGSDFVLVFQAGVRFQPIPAKSDGRTWPHLLMGEKLGMLARAEN